MGKSIVIVSNTSQTSADAKFGYAQRGMIDGVHYDKVVTSGSFLNYFITNYNDEFKKMVNLINGTFKSLFVAYEDVFEGTFIKKVEEYDEADFIYMGPPRTSSGSVRIDDLTENGEPVDIMDVVSKDWSKLKNSDGTQGLSEFAMLLEMCLNKNKILLIANPDIFAHGSVDHSSKKVPIITQGCLGKYYEKLGGKVVYFGKPYPGIFECSKTLVPRAGKIAMIGDTPWTDTLGGNNSGIDTILTLTGIPEEFFKKFDNSLPIIGKIDKLLHQVAPKIANDSENVIPTHIIRKFAA